MSKQTNKQTMERLKYSIYFAIDMGQTEDSHVNTYLYLLREKMNELFNGYTLIESQGYWRHGKYMYQEDSYKLEIITHTDEEMYNTKVGVICEFIKNEFNQKAVIVTTETVNETLI